MNDKIIPPGGCVTGVVHNWAAYILGSYILGCVDSSGAKWPGVTEALRLRRAIMSWAASNALRVLLLATAAATATLGLSLTNAVHADPVIVGGAPGPAFLNFGDQGLEQLGLQKRDGSVFDLTAAEQAALSGAGSSGFLAGLSSTLDCAAGAPAACEPSDAGRASFLGLARSAVATPLPGAIFLFGSVLFGGLGMSARRARRRNRGAVSLLYEAE